MGTNNSQLAVNTDFKYNIQKKCYTPIHTYLAHLIPLLEYRQEIAKRYYKYNSLGVEEEKALVDLIIMVDDKIKEALNIPTSINL